MEDVDGSIIVDNDLPRWIMDYYYKLSVKEKKKLREKIKKKEGGLIK